MQSYSTTQATNLVALAGIVVLIASKLGVELGEGEVQTFIGAAVALYGVVANWIHRYRKGDVTLGGFTR